MKMDQKWSKNPEKVRNSFQAWFPIIFIIWTHKIQNFGILGHFAPFFVIFSRYPKRANPEGTVSINLDFLVKIMFYRSKTIFDTLWTKKIISKSTPENWVEKFAFFNYGIFRHIGFTLIRAHHKHVLIWNFGPNDTMRG